MLRLIFSRPKKQTPLSKEMLEMLNYMLAASDAVKEVEYSAGYQFTSNFFLHNRRLVEKIKKQLKAAEGK
jgi:hypothetical protein